MDGLIEKIHEGSRLGLLDIGERLFKTILAAQANIDQALVNFKLVLEECNLQFFAAQAAAQALDGCTRAAI